VERHGELPVLRRAIVGGRLLGRLFDVRGVAFLGGMGGVGAFVATDTALAGNSGLLHSTLRLFFGRSGMESCQYCDGRSSEDRPLGLSDAG